MQCLYKDKPCSRCGAIIKVGSECNYDGDTKTISHTYQCVEEPPTAEQLALSQRLGFLSSDAALHWHWSELRGEGQRTLWAREE